MDGREHYRRAEGLLVKADDPALSSAQREHAAVRAQVHATLAVAVAINPGLQYDQQPNTMDPWRTEQ